jgi:lipopolysaccharide transport system ATP-binding protein
MSSPIIEVKGISKCYQLGTIGATRLRDDLERAWHRLTGKAEKPDEKEFWALRDVSFEVQPGEIVGIIGRNGAGKSTLLKILSRITEPTHGEIVMRGRVASLLEVGTGFVGDLTGRENIFLNGAILGMTKAEIRSKFDEIVAFAEIEQFIDTPVKRYSSGMYVRLAFAVAAHLEPEILIVDEVLAVGDAAFQKKCLDKLRSISEKGRTVLFVSHQLSTLSTLCTAGAVLQSGACVFMGSAADAIAKYVGTGAASHGLWKLQSAKPVRNKRFHFTSVTLRNDTGSVAGEFAFSSGILFSIHYQADNSIEGAQIAARITNSEGVPILTTANTDFQGKYITLEKGANQISFKIPPNFLSPGRYMTKIACHFPNGSLLDLLDDEISFEIHDESSHRSLLRDCRQGAVNLTIKWDCQPAETTI